MDPEQTFLRVHARLSGVLARLLTPKFRAVLEYLCLFNAVTLLALLVVMHVNFVAQPGCSLEFSGTDVADAQLVQIKITEGWNPVTEGVLSQAKFEGEGKMPIPEGHVVQNPLRHSPAQVVPEVKGDGSNVLAPKFWLNLIHANVRRGRSAKQSVWVDKEPNLPTYAHPPVESTPTTANQKRTSKQLFSPDVIPFKAGPGRGPLGTASLHYLARWSSYIAVCLKRGEQSLRSFWQIWRITGWEPFTASPKGDRRNAAWSQLDAVLVDRSDTGRKVLDPTYLYSVEKGYLMLSESAKSQHNIKTVNVTISAQNVCFGNRWQQLLIDNFVGYDTILMNSLLHARGKGYLYNFQTKELYNLNYLQEFGGVPHGIEDYVVFKCGVLITSLFVFFTATMSVSFTLRETQARMLKFTVQLQHHARHRLPTYRLIFVHVVESLVFVPIMIGILFFLFEFFDDQLLAFMVLTLVWLCELYTMISVRTPLSIRYFPRFFFLYFMVFHVYFFSYTYGFSYLAFSATGAFMQHLVLYFWNQFEVPALQDFLRRTVYQQQHGVQISSAIFRVSRIMNSSMLEDASRLSPNSVIHRTAYSNYHTDNTHRHAGTEVNVGRAQNSDDRNHSRSMESFTMDGSSGMSHSGRSQTDALSRQLNDSLDMASDDMDNDRNIEMGAQRSDVEGVTSTLGDIYRGSTQGAQVSAPSTQPTGTFTSLGSVLPWIFGNGTATVVSLLPIFRDFRDEREDSSTPVTPDQAESSPFSHGISSGTRLRRRYIPAYLPATR